MPRRRGSRNRSALDKAHGSSRSTGTQSKQSYKKHFPRRSIPLALKPHNFVERSVVDDIKLTTAELNVDGNLNTTKTWTFQMSDLPQIASYAKLFEYYRMDKVVVEFRYKCAGQYANTDLSIGRTINEVNPVLIFKVDHNDNAADTLPELLKSMKTKKKQLTNNDPNFSIQIKPAILSELYKTALTSAYAPKWGTYLAMADAGVPHYGLKFQIQVPDPSGNVDYGTIQVSQKIYFTAKNNE